MMRRALLALLGSALLCPAPLGAQVPAGSWRLMRQRDVALHGGLYGESVVTTFADGEVRSDLLTIAPRGAFRRSGTAEYALTPAVALYARVAASRHEAEVWVNFEPRPDIVVRVLEVNAGALVQLGGWLGAGRVFPLYVGAGLAAARQTFDDLLWEGGPSDVSTIAFGLRSRFGLEYAIGRRWALRGEVSRLVTWRVVGALEDDLAAAAARHEGKAARAELAEDPFSLLALSAELRVRL